MRKFNSQTGMYYPPPPVLLIKQSSKLPRVRDQTSPPPRVDPDEEYKEREQKPPNPTHATQPSAATRVKYTKKLKELVQQRRRGHYTGNKYDISRATHRCHKRAQVHQGTIVEPTAQHIAVLATNMQGQHQANVVIEPTTGASLEYRHLIKGPTRAI